MIIHHICIQTNKYFESLKFYVDVLNFKLLEESKNFNQREYNSWLELNGFMIELQTGKKSKELSSFKQEIEGIVHFCLFTNDFENEYKRISNNKTSIFKTKNNSNIYNVGNNKLFKLIAPEGTIIEIRDSKSI